MSTPDLLALLPLLTMALTVVVVLLLTAFVPNHRLLVLITLTGLGWSAALLPRAAAVAPRRVTALLVVDGYALFCTGLLLAAAAAVAGLAYGYLEARPGERAATHHGNFYVLLLLATLGGMVLTAAGHFAALFLGFELLSVALFGLIAYPAQRRRPLEAAAKYLILSGVSSAFLFFGMALIYAQTGTLDFSALGQSFAVRGAGSYALAGFVLTVVAIGFKLSLVPFHMWTPDIYEGAPAPVAAFIATVSKGAVAALLLRYLGEADAYRQADLMRVLAALAIASMLAGNLLALWQDNLKRLLGYSSIAHLGYLLVAVLAGGPFAAEAVGFYLAAYFVTMIGAFGVIGMLSHGAAHERERLEAYRGLWWERPWLAALLTVLLLSLAGLPVTAGFIGKFYLLTAGVHAALWWPVAALVAGSAIGLFYYLRVVAVLYAPPTGALVPAPVTAGRRSGTLVLVLVAALLVGLGVYPGPLARWLAVTAAAVERLP